MVRDELGRLVRHALLMVVLELKLTKNGTDDNRGGIAIAKDWSGQNSGGWAKKIQCVVCRDRGSRSHSEFCCLCNNGMEKRWNHTSTNVKNESERVLRELWRETQWWMHAKTESLGQSERRTRSAVDTGVGDVLMERGNEQQMSDRLAVESGEDEKQHEKQGERCPSCQKRFGDSKRGATWEMEESSTIRARNFHIHRPQPCTCLLNILRVVRITIGQRPSVCSSERRDEWKVREEIRDECQNWSEGCDGSVHIQNWRTEQFATEQSKNFWRTHDKTETWLLIGIPSRDPFFVTHFMERHSASSDQQMKKLMSLREGLHEMMQCYMRQLHADRSFLHKHPGRHASWKETKDIQKNNQNQVNIFR